MICVWTITPGNGGCWLSETDRPGCIWFDDVEEAQEFASIRNGGAEIDWTKYDDGTYVGAGVC